MKENKIPIEIGNLQEHFRNLSQTSKENTEYYGSQFGNIASSNKCLNGRYTFVPALTMVLSGWRQYFYLERVLLPSIRPAYSSVRGYRQAIPFSIPMMG